MKSIYDYILYEGVTYFSLTDEKGMNEITKMAKKLSPFASEILRYRDGVVVIKSDKSIKIIGFKDQSFRQRLSEFLGIAP